MPYIGVNQLAREQLAFQIHQHVDIFVNGKPINAPVAVGIQTNARTGKLLSITELPTHDPTGILHVESGKTLRYKLGQLFGEWGVRLTRTYLRNFKGGCDNLH